MAPFKQFSQQRMIKYYVKQKHWRWKLKPVGSSQTSTSSV